MADITGSSDVISGETGVNVNLFGTGDMATLGNNATGIAYGADDSLTGGSGSNFNLTQNNDSATVGAGSYVGIPGGTADYVSESNGQLNTLDGVQLTLNGSGDTVAAGNSVSLSVTGSNDILGVGSYSATVVTGTADTVNGGGTGGYVGLTGSGDAANISNAYVDVGIGSYEAAVQGTGDGVQLGNYVTASVAGGGNVIANTGLDDVTTLSGDGNYLSQTSGVVVITDGSDTANLSGAYVALGNGSTLTAYGDGDIVSAGQADTTSLDGNGNTLAQTGGTVMLTGSGETGYLNGTTLTLGGSTEADIGGNGNTIASTVGDDLTAYGGANVISGGGQERIEVVNTYGVADTIAVSGDDNNVKATDGKTAGIYLDGNAQAHVEGSSDAISTAAGDTLAVDGGGSAISGGGNERITISDTNGTADTVAVSNDDDNTKAYDGQTAGIYITSNAQANLNGSADAVLLGDETGLTVNSGSGNLITAGQYDDTQVYGSGNTVDQTTGTVGFSGGGNTADVSYANITEASNSGLTLNGAGNNVTLGDETGLAVDSGSGNTIDAGQYDDTQVYSSGNTVNQNTGTADFSGSGNTANVSDTSVYDADHSGLTINGSSNTIGLGYETGLTVDSGSGNTINAGQYDDTQVYSSNNTVNQSTGTADFSGGGNTANVNYVNVGDASYSGLTLNGSGNTVGLGYETGLTIDSGSGNTVNAGQYDLTQVYSSNNTVNQTTGTADFSGNGITANVNYVTVNESANSSLNLNGNVDTVNLTGNDTLGAYGGANTINAGAGDNVYLGNTNGSADTVNANGDQLGNGNGIYLYGNTQAILDGSNDGINLTASGDTTTVNGNGDTVSANGGTVNFNGTGEVGDVNGTTVLLGASTTANIVGNGDTLNFGQGDIVGINGSYDAINASLHDSTSIIGNYDNYNAEYGNGQTGANDTLGIAGIGEVIDASYNTISLGSGTSVSGNGDNYDKIFAVSGDTANITQSYDDNAYGNNLNNFEISGGSGNTLTGTGDGSDAENGFTIDNTSYTGPDNPGDGTDDYSDDPIILNLSGQSVQTQSRANSTAFFDMQNSGQPVQTGWLTAGEGVLAYDPSNAPVTRGSQLVAGFGALSALAQPSSITLDASNPLFDHLKVWVDPTGDAQFKPQDLHSLQDLGITSISLTPQSESVASNGNVILDDSTFTWKGGATGDIAGVDLFYNPSSFANSVSAPALISAPDALTAAINDLSATQAGASFSPLGDAHGTASPAFDTSSLTAVTTAPANALLPVFQAA